MEITVDGIKIVCNVKIGKKEVRKYIKFEKERFPYKKIDELCIEINGDDVLLKPRFQTIVRLRRITGYMSNVNNFNQAKKEEANDSSRGI